ncbi:phenylacetate--CoA ligase family protein [Auritidibacter sp. NML100628]|uniref:phenylacetate--CoA ligase family protein n=1 Tax=Auritidibacter sp. NML100628 TaxID=2170742 RepID=UPI001F1BD3A5|nr:phenylacetate--CoA ligase family protein [Auritidibacter sp. NML100628]
MSRSSLRRVLRKASRRLRGTGTRSMVTRDDDELLPLPIKSAPINIARQIALRAANFGLTSLYSIYRLDPALWRLTAKNYHPCLERFAKLNAWMICQHASLDVPAYQDYLVRNDYEFSWWDLTSYPPTSKDDYVRAYGEASRCWDGEIEVAGTVVDESSGSTGTPFNWMRSKDETATVHKNVAGYVTMLFGGKNLFCINAFSMGAWATGTNTGQAMAKIAMVKNTGPDLEKILDTLRHFGPRFTYLISAYPPFLKHLKDLLDECGDEFAEYTINGFVGGEAMTEGLRDYLLGTFDRVYSGYGASDLTIGMGGETDLSITLRKELIANPAFRTALLGQNETRTPMIFQYNPLETYMETTDDGELMVTINSSAVMSPRLRYNIGDEARILSFPEMVQITSAFPQLVPRLKEAYRNQQMKLPFLLLFGRKDSTISYMGANIYPLDVQNGLYRDPEAAKVIDSFQIELMEIGDFEHRPRMHIQLRDPETYPAARLDQVAKDQLADQLSEQVLDHLASVSRDVAVSLTEDASAAEIRVVVHDFGTGPFSDPNTKIKNVYLTRTQHDERQS